MRPHLSLLGVPVTLRPTALGVGLLSALVVAFVSRDHRAAWGLAAGMLWYTADATHVIGHIISSRMVEAPMHAIDFGLYPMSVYLNHDVSPQQHLGRACGGVGASLIAALSLTMLARITTTSPARQLLTIAAAQHGLLFGASMLPVQLVDGGIIYTNLRQILRAKD
jgi:hypothetical protein